MDPSDGQLVQQVLAGQRKGFDELVARYQRQAVAVSYRLLGNTQDAMEVTQDAFLKAFTSLDSLQKPEAFGGWLMRIVSNLSLNYRRSRKIRQQLPLDDALGPTHSDSQEAAGGGSEWMSRGDGPVAEATLEDALAADGVARALLADYQRLNGALKAMPTPEIAWDELAARINSETAKHDVPVKHYRLNFATWSKVAALAAMVTII